jgi:hypothetical protein
VRCRTSSSPSGEVNDTTDRSKPPGGVSCTNAIGGNAPPPLELGADSAPDKSAGDERSSSKGGGDRGGGALATSIDIERL